MAKGFTIIANKGSGSHPKGELREALRTHVESRGIPVTFVTLDPAGGADLDGICLDAVRAAKKRGDTVVAAGGDGTLNTVASFCHTENVPLGIIPMGTFNYFAREHGIPTEVNEAAQLLLTGRLRPARIGRVNGHAFLVNASLGLYSAVIRNRENDKATFGRHRIVAAVSAIVSFFRAGRVFRVALDTPEGRINRETMMVFICNSHFQMQKLGLEGGDDNPPGTLDMVVMKPMNAWQMLRLFFLSAIGQLRLEERLEEFTAPAFTVEKSARHAEVVIDGEIVTLAPPLRFEALQDGLHIICPADAETPA
jgi:diacylglycerol kinase family enzyme